MLDLRERWGRWRTQRWVIDRAVVPANPLADVGLRAIVSAWHEADIVGITVANALEQGCDSVHLVDDGSADRTAEVAAEAGATVEATRTSARFDLEDVTRAMTGVVERVSRASGASNVWWLYLDADELVQGPDGTTVRAFLQGLDRSVRVVGSRTFNHYPRADRPLAPGTDPRQVATNAQERTGPACRLGHWKHPLVRWDAAGPEVVPEGGFHVARAGGRLIEPRGAVISHHYPYRAREVTEARLELLRPRLVGHRWAMSRRLANLDAVYREAYDEVDPFDMVGPGQHLAPEPHPPVRDAAQA